MSESINRRRFIRSSLAATTGAGMTFHFEEKALQARENGDSVHSGEPGPDVDGLQIGTMCGLKVSRIICGGNLISGFAHSRDLIYVSRLLTM